MGYTTDFSGKYSIAPPLRPEHRAYLVAFSRTRRMARNEQAVAALPDPIREAAGLPLGPQGAFYVGDSEADNTLLTSKHGWPDHNTPPEGQPGLWCQWIPNEDGTALAWDEGEKFYNYIEWLRYLVKTFLTPWGYVLNGEISWSGEEDDDRGIIFVKDNQVEAVEDIIRNDDPSWRKKV